MLSAEEVARYLEQHPDFLDRHPQLLEHLNVPHGGNGTISLVERQMRVLRERQAASRERLAELVSVARGNDLLAERIHKFTLRLLHARTATDVQAQLEASMREDFAVTHQRLVLDGASLPELSALLSSGKPRCGHFSAAQRSALFGEAGAALGSIAIVPIGPGASQGVLLLGSEDPDRFNPAMSTDFLVRIGEMTGAALARTGIEPRV